jgi:hypothetical protein
MQIENFSFTLNVGEMAQKPGVFTWLFHPQK